MPVSMKNAQAANYISVRQHLAVMDRIEDAAGPMDSPQFLAFLRTRLLDEEALSMLDATLLAACVGDAGGSRRSGCHWRRCS